MEYGRITKGSYTFSSGNHYEGNFDFATGSICGQGTFTNQDEIITGMWKDGKLNGEGQRQYVNGDFYGGNWIDDNLEGHGIFKTIDAGEYKGEFHKSLEHGNGYRTYADGSNYNGQWQFGKRHG